MELTSLISKPQIASLMVLSNFMIRFSSLVPVRARYLARIAVSVSNPCCTVENYFGCADVLNALPFL